MTRKIAVIIAILLASVGVDAQSLLVTTLQTKDTSVTSVKVGCAAGSNTCVGGISAAILTLAGGYLEIGSNVPGVTTNRLYNNGGTLTWNGGALAVGGAVGPGTNGHVTKFTGATSLGDTGCTESAGALTCTSFVGPVSASQTTITGVGTITTGTWNATKIGLAYGGTNADLSATGGASQFLRQNSSGAAITVVRPAIADLSDGANAVQIGNANVYTANQTVTTTTGTSLWLNTNTSGSLGIGVDNSTGSFWGLGTNYIAGVITTAANGLAVGTKNAAGNLTFITNGAGKWGINPAGDWITVGGHIVDSEGTPTLTGSWGIGASIVGNDFAFRITAGSSLTGITAGVTFGHTFTNAPVCVLESTDTSLIVSPTTTTTATFFTVGGTNIGTGSTTAVLCRGF